MRGVQWITSAIEGATSWPAQEMVVEYNGRAFRLLPETEHLARSVALQVLPGESSETTYELILRFLSAAAWAEDSPLVVSYTIGGGRPGAVGRSEERPRRPGSDRFHVDYLPSPTDPRARLALGFYREGLSLRNPAYAFLCFYKIINILHANGDDQKRWINQAIPRLTDSRATARLKELQPSIADLGDYFFVSGRCAVSHAFSHPLVDPDNPSDSKRLDGDLPVIKALAVHLIEHELGIKSGRTVRAEHLHELAGFKTILGVDWTARFKAGESPDPATIPSFPSLTLRVRGKDRYAAFERMGTKIFAVDRGRMILELSSADALVKARVGLDFPGERLLITHNALEVSDDGSAAAVSHALDEHQIILDLCENRELEVWSEDGAILIGRSACYVPMNSRMAPKERLDKIRNDLETLLRDRRAKEVKEGPHG